MFHRLYDQIHDSINMLEFLFPFIYRILSPDYVLPRDTCHMTVDGILRSHLRVKITVYNILSVMQAAPFSVKIVITNTMKSVSSVQILTQ